jgi:hypothetical protein
MDTKPFETLHDDELRKTTGGFDIAGLANGIGGLVDQFAGTGGKATQIAGQIGGLVQSFMPKG